MKSLFDKEQDKMVTIRLTAESRGNEEFYSTLTSEIAAISNSWNDMHKKRSISSEELASLIETKFNLIRHIKSLK